MGVITDILSVVDATVNTVAETGFTQMAGTVGGVISVGAGLLVVLLGINVVMQIQPMSPGSFFAFAIKIGLVGIFAQSWPNFQVIYNIITQVPDSIGAAILDVGGGQTAAGLYAALDAMVSRVTAYGDAIGDRAGWVFGAVLGALVFLVAGAFAAVAAGIIAFAKIVLTLMIVFAPFAIVCSLFKPTLPLFEAWTRSIIGYALMPIAAAGAAGIIVAVAETIASGGPNPDSVETLSLIFPFIVVLILAAGIMTQVPAIAMGLSGAIGLASNAFGMTGLTKQGLVKTGAMGRKATGQTGSWGSQFMESARARMNGSPDGASSISPKTNPAARLAQTQALRQKK